MWPAWLAPLAVLGLLAAGCDRGGRRLETIPPGATVWYGEAILGCTPLSLPRDLPPDASLRLSLPGYTDQLVALTSAVAGEAGGLSVTLTSQGRLSLRCESEPAGADLYVDGEFRGKTPVELQPLEPRSVELVFIMANRETVARTVDLGGEDPPDRVTVSLPSLTEQYYRQQVEKEPRNIHHYGDLAHHYMLEKRFADAMEVFGNALTMLIVSPGVRDTERLWSEIERVTEEQYEYGDAEDVRRARTALRDKLTEVLAKHPDAALPELHLNLILVLDSLDQRQQAQEAFERAWRRFPNDRTLSRLRRQGFAIP